MEVLWGGGDKEKERKKERKKEKKTCLYKDIVMGVPWRIMIKPDKTDKFELGNFSAQAYVHQ